MTYEEKQRAALEGVAGVKYTMPDEIWIPNDGEDCIMLNDRRLDKEKWTKYIKASIVNKPDLSLLENLLSLLNKDSLTDHEKLYDARVVINHILRNVISNSSSHDTISPPVKEDAAEREPAVRDYSPKECTSSTSPAQENKYPYLAEELQHVPNVVQPAQDDVAEAIITAKDLYPDSECVKTLIRAATRPEPEKATFEKIGDAIEEAMFDEGAYLQKHERLPQHPANHYARRICQRLSGFVITNTGDGDE